MSNEDRAVTGATDESRPPSATELERVIADWQRFRASLLTDEELVEDENAVALAFKLVEDNPEIVDPRVTLSQLIDAAVWTERRFEEAKQLKAKYDARRARYERRLEEQRALIERFMAAIPVKRHRGAEASATLGEAPSSLVVIDEQLIPDEWFKVERTLRRGDLRDHVRETGEIVPGTYLSNGGTKLTLRKVA